MMHIPRLDVVDQLGAAIEGRWRREHYNDAAFPAIACDALQEAALVARLDPWEIVRWLHRVPALPLQQDVDADFSDLPLTVFSGSRFHIDAYFWLDGTTTIHQHAFSGAFQVLMGGSVHSEYRFARERVVSDHLEIGQVALERVELLGLGDIRPIAPGRGHLHALFHLERPSLTVTVRTGHSPSAGVQFDYLRPGLAIDQHYRNAEMITRVRSASMLFAVGHPDAEALVADLVGDTDFHTAFLVLREAFEHLKPSPMEALFDLPGKGRRFDRLLDRARAAHGTLVDVVRPALDEQARQRDIVARRSSITAGPHRFLLALLLNVPDRQTILRLVSEKVHDRDPVDVVLEWVDELTRIQTFGSREANVLGLSDYGPAHRAALEGALRGASVADGAAARQLMASPLSPLVSP